MMIFNEKSDIVSGRTGWEFIENTKKASQYDSSYYSTHFSEIFMFLHNIFFLKNQIFNEFPLFN